MARPLRIEYPGALYHLTSRGNARAPIFLDDQDRRRMLLVVAGLVARYGWRIHAYCLMGNHYHLLAETPRPNLSRGMRWLNGVYTQRFNRRHARVGHVFQGRFKAILVERDRYLLELARYIVLNPVRAGLAAGAGDWPWSSYRATSGACPAPAWLCTAWVIEQFGDSTAAARHRYREFVNAGSGQQSPWEQLRGQVFLGSDAFVQTLAPRLAELGGTPEAPRAQRLAPRPSLAELLLPCATTDRACREAAIQDAYLRHSYTLADIARHLGVHYTTVSRLANRTMHQSKT